MKKIFFIILFITISLFSSELDEGLEFYKNNDYDKAFKILSKYENKNDPVIFYNLAYMINEGLGTNKNANKSKDLFKKAHDIFIKEALYGNIESMSYLANLYYNGYGITEDLNKSFYWHLKAAEGGDIYSIRFAGSMYENGEGTKKDLQKAIYWYEIGANLGDLDSQVSLSLALISSGNIASSIYWFEKAANGGDIDSLITLSLKYKYFASKETNEKIKLQLLKNSYDLLKKVEEKDKQRYEELEKFPQDIITKIANVSPLNFKEHWIYQTLQCEEEAYVKLNLRESNVENCLKAINTLNNWGTLSKEQLEYLNEVYFNAGMIYQNNIKSINHKEAFKMYMKSYSLGGCDKETKCIVGKKLGFYYFTGIGENEKNSKLAYKYFKESLDKGNLEVKKDLEFLCSKYPNDCK